MTFLETPRMPIAVTYGTDGGPEFSTTIIEVGNGYEYANINRGGISRWRGTLVRSALVQAEWRELMAFFRAVKGAAHGFRVKDWTDYAATTAEGVLGTGLGTGLPAYQATKRYAAGALYDDRPIRKLVTGTFAAQRNAVAMVAGAGAGQYAIDTTTGLLTIVADATSNATSITVGATTQVVLGADLGLSAGKKLYLTGFAGADAALVNGLAHTINTLTGAGPYTFTLATNTAGKTITLGSGQGRAYPQASDVLTWSGEFDIPVRFVSDRVRARIVSNQGGGKYVVQWDDAEVIEVFGV